MCVCVCVYVCVCVCERERERVCVCERVHTHVSESMEHPCGFCVVYVQMASMEQTKSLRFSQGVMIPASILFFKSSNHGNQE